MSAEFCVTTPVWKIRRSLENQNENTLTKYSAVSSPSNTALKVYASTYVQSYTYLFAFMSYHPISPHFKLCHIAVTAVVGFHLIQLINVCAVIKLFIGPSCTCVCTCVDGLLYGVTGPTGVLLPQGFTIDLVEDERYSVDLIATWSPDDKVIIMSQVQSLKV